MTRTRAHQTSHSRFLLRAPLALVSPPSLPRLVSPSTSRPRSLPSARVGNLHRRIHPATSSSPKRRAPPPSSLAPPHRAFTRSLFRARRSIRRRCRSDPSRVRSVQSRPTNPSVVRSVVRSFAPSRARSRRRSFHRIDRRVDASRTRVGRRFDRHSINSIQSIRRGARVTSRRHAPVSRTHGLRARVTTTNLDVDDVYNTSRWVPFPIPFPGWDTRVPPNDRS